MNSTAINYQISPLERLTYWAEVKGNDVYLTQPLADGSVEELTWAQVDDQARRMAQYLRSLNLPEHSNIILLGKNSAHWIVADLAIWMAGHVSVPLYATLSAESARYVMDHCEAQLLIVGKMGGQDDNWQQIRAVLPEGLPAVALPFAPQGDDFQYQQQWSEIMTHCSPLQQVDERDPEALATIIYTSGTTGKPKGVMHCFRSLCAPSMVTQELWHTGSDDRMLSYLPLAHIAERVAVEIPSLMFGFQLFFNHSLETFPQDLQRARPTRFFTVPRLWGKFYQAVCAKISPAKQKVLFALPVIGKQLKQKILRQLGLDCVRAGLTGAAPLAADIINWYRTLGLDLLEVFGMTENAATSHSTRPGDYVSGYVGTPLPGVTCVIADNGEVLTHSPGQMLGYYKNPQATAESYTADGLFHTGDRGELDSEGRLRITGRVKELFKTSKGKYIAPVPIENRLASSPLLEVVCVTGPGQPQPFVLAMLSPGVSQDEQALSAELGKLLDSVNAQLEEHERLDYMVVTRDPWTIESGMLTPTMKLRRDKIEEVYLGFADQWREQGRKVIWH
ncbi:AMP-binding protein [Pseudomaricurvus sp. HS19]|nr:AMP-binding protein [Pseudomaricurvus sp. HS19]